MISLADFAKMTPMERVIAGLSFKGQGITTDIPTSPDGMSGSVQLWNPWGSGQIAFLTRAMLVGNASGEPAPRQMATDVRRTKVKLANLFPDHITNCLPGGDVSRMQIRTEVGVAQADYPTNRPFQECWPGVTNTDGVPYDWEDPIGIAQGEGIFIPMAGATKAIASLQWCVVDDPAGVKPEPVLTLIPPSQGTVVSFNLINAENVFDGNEGTYANDSEGSYVEIGATYPDEKTIDEIVVKSLPGRSFSGGNPGRTFNWIRETYNGTMYVTHSTGSFTESGTGTTQSVLRLQGRSVGQGWRVCLQNSAAASHRLAQCEAFTQS